MATATQSLNTGWKFSRAGTDDWHPAEVPGDVHTDLFRGRLIPDPFYRLNEADVQWVDKVDWIYETLFDVDPAILQAHEVDLVFDGLDTYCTVTLNGHDILSADNMFRVWRTAVKHHLRATNNRLTVHFRSPIEEDRPKLARLGYGLPASNDQSERGGVGQDKLSVFARKAPYHYGWDWGPRLVTSGIWRPVRLEAWSHVRLADVFVRTESVSDAEAKLAVTVDIVASLNWTGSLTVSIGDVSQALEVSVEPGSNTVDLSLTLPEPRLWWCRGLGEAHLYAVRTELTSAGEVLSARDARVGVRTLRLVQDPDDRGTSFYFELNGVPVFAKGANHIPNDSFVTQVTRERYQRELDTAVASHMNMLRVWGGGIYEDDVFYDLADEAGILIWQDFMFACSMYPGDEAFLASVRQEADDNLRRLRNHPCIALWCGNNEMDEAWAETEEKAGWGWKQQYEPSVRAAIWQAYESLFHELLPSRVAALTPGTPYWPSSPTRDRSPERFRHGPDEPVSGDVHYWGLARHPEKSFHAYDEHIGRFMSEYGFQSLPAWETVLQYTTPEDHDLASAVMRWHQRSGEGGRLITDYLDAYYPPAKDFRSLLYLSQVVQADGIRTAIEAHRRHKPFCMGSLYWQINDCWPVASWSSMDYFGRWKVLQYVARRAFRDVALSITAADGLLHVYAVSDRLDRVKGTVHLTLLSLDGTALQSSEQPIDLPPNQAAVVYSVSEAELLGDRDSAQVVWEARLDAENAELDHYYYYFTRPKAMKLAPAHVTITDAPPHDGASFALSTDTLARSVWVSAEGQGIFSDNGFDLVPGVPKTITYLTHVPGKGFVPSQAQGVVAQSLTDFLET